MGVPMALRLAQAGHTVTVWNRTPDKLAPLQAAGIAIADFPATALQASSVTVLMLADAEAIRQVVLTEPAIFALAHHTLIQMGTIAPQHSKVLRDEVIAAGGAYLEAPVLGSITQAESGTLSVMVGATAEQFADWLPVLQVFGEQVIHIGSVGTAAAAKLALNQLIGSMTTAFALSLGLAQREGIEVDQLMQILRTSALYAPTFDKKLDRMLTRNFGNPNFPTKHLLKDMNLFVEAAQAAGLNAALAESVSLVVQQAMELGLADADYSALFNAVNPEDGSVSSRGD